MITLLRVLSFALGTAGVVLFALWRFLFAQEREGHEKRVKNIRWARSGEPEPPAPQDEHRYGIPIGMTVAGFLLLIVLSGATMVKPTEVAVVENTLTGHFYALQPGTHIWPFSDKIVPLVTNVTHYSLRRQRIEIGEAPGDAQIAEGQSRTQAFGIPSASSSPGQPVVYIWARGWAIPNKEKIVMLHQQYGKEYLTAWVESQWVTTIKDVQGRHPLDYLQEHRGAMQTEIEQALQRELLDADEIPIVIVSQLAIQDYDYEHQINEYLNNIAQREFDRQQEVARTEVERQKQIADGIAADTAYLVQVRQAEATRDERIAEAEGQAEEQRQLADAEAYEIEVTYAAEAEGIRLVNAALRGSSEYVSYLQAQSWDGKLPTWWMPGQDVGSIPVPILDVEK